jgi:hypothetical protein
MEPAVFSAASLFHADDDSDDDGRRGKVDPAPPPSPWPARATAHYVAHHVLLSDCLFPSSPFHAIKDQTQVGAEGENQEQALEYEERIHKFPGVVNYLNCSQSQCRSCPKQPANKQID